LTIALHRGHPNLQAWGVAGFVQEEQHQLLFGEFIETLLLR